MQRRKERYSVVRVFREGKLLLSCSLLRSGSPPKRVQLGLSRALGLRCAPIWLPIIEVAWKREWLGGMTFAALINVRAAWTLFLLDGMPCLPSRRSPLACCTLVSVTFAPRFLCALRAIKPAEAVYWSELGPQRRCPFVPQGCTCNCCDAPARTGGRARG